MVDDGTAKFAVKIVCAKEYVDAVNATVTEVKEKHIFRFDVVNKAAMTRLDAGVIRFSNIIPQGYERLALIAYSNGVTIKYEPDLANPLYKTSDFIDLYIQGAAVDTANEAWNLLQNFAVFTIFVKEG